MMSLAFAYYFSDFFLMSFFFAASKAKVLHREDDADEGMQMVTATLRNTALRPLPWDVLRRCLPSLIDNVASVWNVFGANPGSGDCAFPSVGLLDTTSTIAR